MTGKYFINDTNIWDVYGMFPPSGKDFYAQLLKAPIRKEGLTKNWPDQNGTQRSFHNIEYEDRQLDLPFVMYATSKAQLLEQYNALSAFVFANEYMSFKCVDLDRLFTLKYRAMPTFNKLTSFEDNDRIAIEFSISFIDEYPTVFKKADGSAITMTFPPDVPDDDIDFSSFGFEIVGSDLIMTGDFSSNVDGYALNGNYIEDVYGLFPQKGFDNELFKLPESKGEVPLKFQSRTLELPFYLRASSDIEFYYKYYSLVAFFLESTKFNLDVVRLNKRVVLTYSGMTAFDKLTLISGNNTIVAGLKITCYDDQPTINGSVPLFDGHFEINHLGQLIYKQSVIFNGKINFYLDDNGNLIKKLF